MITRIDLEEGALRQAGNLGYQAAISTAISAKRAADTLERIEALLATLPPATEKAEK